MAAIDIQIKAKAKKLLEAGRSEFEGYRRMSTDELRKLIAKAERGTGKGKAPKGKATSDGKGTKGAAARVVKGKGSGTKGRASTSAPAKSASRKSSPAKGKAAKGAQAKRQATGASAKGKATTVKGRAKATPKGRASAKPKAQAGRPKRGRQSFRAELGKIKWNLESNVGRTGKRKEVLDALRAMKGDKTAAFKKLKRKATKFYPDKDQHDAERMLVWLIGRVAFDYAMSTDQHEPGVRAGYGESTNPSDVRRRERRAALAAEREKAARRTKRQARGKPAKTAARKSSAKGKASAKRKTAKGKGRR